MNTVCIHKLAPFESFPRASKRERCEQERCELRRREREGETVLESLITFVFVWKIAGFMHQTALFRNIILSL